MVDAVPPGGKPTPSTNPVSANSSESGGALAPEQFRAATGLLKHALQPPDHPAAWDRDQGAPQSHLLRKRADMGAGRQQAAPRNSAGRAGAGAPPPQVSTGPAASSEQAQPRSQIQCPKLPIPRHRKLDTPSTSRRPITTRSHWPPGHASHPPEDSQRVPGPGRASASDTVREASQRPKGKSTLQRFLSRQPRPTSAQEQLQTQPKR